MSVWPTDIIFMFRFNHLELCETYVTTIHSNLSQEHQQMKKSFHNKDSVSSCFFKIRYFVYNAAT